jgi:hypothetical protein
MFIDRQNLESRPAMAATAALRFAGKNLFPKAAQTAATAARAAMYISRPLKTSIRFWIFPAGQYGKRKTVCRAKGQTAAG